MLIGAISIMSRINKANYHQVLFGYKGLCLTLINVFFFLKLFAKDPNLL